MGKDKFLQVDDDIVKYIVDKVKNPIYKKNYVGVVIYINYVKAKVTLSVTEYYQKVEESAHTLAIYVKDINGVLNRENTTDEITEGLRNMVESVLKETTFYFPFNYVFETGEFVTWTYRVRASDYTRDLLKSKKYAYKNAATKQYGSRIISVRHDKPKKYVNYENL